MIYGDDDRNFVELFCMRMNTAGEPNLDVTVT